MLQRLRSMVTPRSSAAAAAAAAAAAEGDVSLQSTPGSRRVSSRLPGTCAATASVPTAQQHVAGDLAAGPAADEGADEPAAEAQGQAWWPQVKQAAEQLTTHPDFQLAVMLVILLNCIGGAVCRPADGLGTCCLICSRWLDASAGVAMTAVRHATLEWA